MNRLILLASTAALAACATTEVDPLLTPPEADMGPAPAPAATTTTGATLTPQPAATPARDPRLETFFETYDQAQLELNPLSKAYRGIVDEDYGRWGDFSDAAAVREHQLDQRFLAQMRGQFDPSRLSPEDRLSYELFENMVERSAGAFAFRKNVYLFDQMNGAQSDIPAFLINIHKVTDVPTAEAYVSRLRGVDEAMDQLIAQAKERQALGVLPPKWVYPYVISDARNVVSGAPFGPGEDSALFADFKEKVNALSVAEAEKQRLIAAARDALLRDVQPAYQRIIALMEAQQQVAPTDDGVWRLANGAAYYNERLRYYTTTGLTAEEIHDIGLREVARIHGEMRQIMARVGFEGSLQDFFQHLRSEDRFYHETEEAYLAEVEQVLAAMRAALPRFFNTLPKSELVVKPVEPFREQSAGKAFYNSPAPDGSRPGTYYVNLYNLRDMSKTELEALAYHEGLPGHHLQRSIQTELGGKLPPFRQFGGVTAYTEGWGLYSEALGKDMGFYQDPYSDFGRLGMELWRAARLVVDTGLHHKRWSREQAIAWLQQNTPNPEGDIRKAIERYIVYPGQATAYMVGKLKIMELRERARTELGDRFDIKAFHDVILLSGPVPLDVMERRVDEWIASRRAS